MYLFFRIFILHSMPSCNSFLAVVIMSYKAYIAQAFQNWRCILNMTWNITRVSACCPMCCIIYYHSPFIKCLLDNKASTKSVCLASHLSIFHIPNTEQSSVACIHFSALVHTECLLRVGEQATLQKRAEKTSKSLPWTRGRKWVAVSAFGVQFCNRHCIL